MTQTRFKFELICIFIKYRNELKNRREELKTGRKIYHQALADASTW